MSVEEFRARHQQLRLAMKVVPECWVVIANSVFGRAESYAPVAAFDTRELADAYVEASKLPEHLKGTCVERYYRSFRRDSLLWDYNAEVYDSSGCNMPGTPPPPPRGQLSRQVTNLNFDLMDLPVNPPPPAGPCPPLDVPAERRAAP